MDKVHGPTITICCSCNFYRQAIEAKTKLEQFGYKIIVPKTALEMERHDDYDVSRHKTWFADDKDYAKKGQLMRRHFEEVAKADAILVLNYEKHGHRDYIGPNVLMEMALAFHQQKPIFVLNDLPEDSPFEEELRGMQPVVLRGEIVNLTKIYS